MKRHGVDSWQSWKTMFLMSPLFVLTAVSIRVGGFIFIGLLKDLALSRQEASWPLTVQTFFLHVAAPQVSVLSQWLSHTTVLRACVFISSFSLMLCYFARDLVTLTLILGVVHGSAQAGFFTAGNIILCGHFDKRRSTATGVSMTISASSMLFMPAVYSYFFEKFGLSKSFLILGIVSLFSALLSFAIHENKFIEKAAEKPPTIKVQADDEANCSRTSSSNITRDGGKAVSAGTAAAGAAIPAPAEVQLQVAEKRSRCSSLASIADATGSVTCVATFSTPSKQEQASESGGEISKEPMSFGTRLNCLMTATFFLDALSYALIFSTMTTFYQVAVDFAMDKGFDKKVSMWCFSAYCIGDIILRSSIGLAIDGNVLSTSGLMAIGFTLQSLALAMFTFGSSAVCLLGACFLMGASNGARQVVHMVILIADFGLAALAHTLGLSKFINGFTVLMRPPLIGYFRDTRNDYEGLFAIYIPLNLLLALLWTIRWLRSRR